MKLLGRHLSEDLTDIGVQFSMCRNNPFHKSCYKELFHPKCDVCKQFVSLLKALAFLLRLRFLFLCDTCYDEPVLGNHTLFQIPTNSTGLIEYRAHPFWLQKYCPSHEMDSTPRCCSCERVEVRMKPLF
jgi:hypothetical protein